MLKHLRSFCTSCIFLTALNCTAQKSQPTPRVYTCDAKKLVEVRKRAQSGVPALTDAVHTRVDKANRFLGEPNVAVTQKSADAIKYGITDLHSYSSLSIYYWPDSTNANAPWIRHDGKTNREWASKFDAPRMGKLTDRVTTLTMAWWVTSDNRYARMAAAQLRIWFIDKDTYMEPQMDGAQFIPNNKAYGNGTNYCIIQAEGLPGIINAVGMLELSDEWTIKDALVLKQWFVAFNKWLVESKNEPIESIQPNNHGIYYDILLASGTLFTGYTAAVIKTLNEVSKKRINSQIEADGSMPRQLARAGSFGYLFKNLEGLLRLGTIADKVNIDLFHYSSVNNRSIKSALDWVVPYLQHTKPWLWNEHVEPEGLLHIFWPSSFIYPGHKEVLDKNILSFLLTSKIKNDVFELYFPL